MVLIPFFCSSLSVVRLSFTCALAAGVFTSFSPLWMEVFQSCIWSNKTIKRHNNYEYKLSVVKIENPSKLTLANLNQQGLRTNNYLQIRQQHPAIILIRGVGFIIPRTWSPASYQLSLLGF